jgi:hypothetical protein
MNKNRLAKAITSIIKKAQENSNNGTGNPQSGVGDPDSSHNQGTGSGSSIWPWVVWGGLGTLGTLGAGGGIYAAYRKWPQISGAAQSAWEGIKWPFKFIHQRLKPSTGTASTATPEQQVSQSVPESQQTPTPVSPITTNVVNPAQPEEKPPAIQHPEYNPAGKYAFQSDLIELYESITRYRVGQTWGTDRSFYGETDNTGRILSHGAFHVYSENLKRLFGDTEIAKDPVAGRPAQLLAILATMEELPSRKEFSRVGGGGGKAVIAARALEHRYKFLSEVYYPASYLETRVEKQSLKSLFQEAIKNNRPLTFIGGRDGKFKVFTWNPNGRVTTEDLSEADVSTLRNVLRQHIRSRLQATQHLLGYADEVLKQESTIKPGEEEKWQKKRDNFIQTRDEIRNYQDRLSGIDKILEKGQFTDAGGELYSITKELIKTQRELAMSKTVVSFLNSGYYLTEQVRPSTDILKYFQTGEPAFRITEARGRLSGLNGVLLPVVNPTDQFSLPNTDIGKILIRRQQPVYSMHSDSRVVSFVRGLSRAGRR